MTSSLPEQVQEAFESFITTEFTTVDARQQPITWPVTPYYRAGAPTIDKYPVFGRTPTSSVIDVPSRCMCGHHAKISMSFSVVSITNASPAGSNGATARD